MRRIIGLFFFFSLICSVHLQAQSKEVEVIEELVSLKNEMVQKNELGKRYKIQLGSYTSMETAEGVKRKFEASYEGLPSQLEYESPHYKVWVGDFTTKLAAERVFVGLKKDFKSALVFRPNH